MRDAVQVVQERLVLQLVYLVKDCNVRRVICGSKAVEQAVFRCGLPVDVHGLIDAVEKAVQGFEPGVVFLAVDVLVVEVHDRFAELFDEELCNVGLSSTGWTVKEAGSARRSSVIGSRTLER